MTGAARRRMKESLEAYAYLAPAGLILLAFWFAPVVVALVFSFFDATALAPPSELNFVGIAQYKRALFDDPEFVQSVWNTINFAVYKVPITLVLSLLAALLLNSQIKGRAFFRTVFFLPHVTTWVAIAIVWNYLYHREFGLANWFVDTLHSAMPWVKNDPNAPPVRLEWLAEPRGIWEMMFWEPIAKTRLGHWPFGLDNVARGPSLSLFSIAITAIWRDVGYCMILFLAGLQNIDKAVYEAADIDGASPWGKFRNITFPLLSPVTFFLLIISCIGSFQEFTPMFVMTPNGGPDYTTAPIVFHMYEKGFMGQWELSYASAIAYILTFMIFLLTIVQDKTIGKRVEYGS